MKSRKAPIIKKTIKKIKINQQMKTFFVVFFFWTLFYVVFSQSTTVQVNGMTYPVRPYQKFFNILGKSFTATINSTGSQILIDNSGGYFVEYPYDVTPNTRFNLTVNASRVRNK